MGWVHKRGKEEKERGKRKRKGGRKSRQRSKQPPSPGLIRAAFRVGVKQFPPWTPLPPSCFHRKRILGRFQCAPRGRTMRPLKPGILASFCYPGAGEGGCAEGTRGPTQGPLVGEGLAYRVSPSRPGEARQPNHRLGSAGGAEVPGVYPAPRIGAGKGGGDEDPITAAPARSPGGGGRDGDTEPRAGRPGMLGPQLRPGLSCLIVYCGAGRSPSRPLPRARPPAPVLPPTRRKKSQSVEANES